MIYDALNCIKEEIDSFFQSKLKINEEKIVLSAIMNQDGTIAIPGENKIVITLINIEREPVATFNTGGGARSFSNTSSALSVNLSVLFSAYFSNSNYDDSLQLLSQVISFLQDKSVFTQSNTPRLDSSIEKLSLEMESISSEKLNNIWATLGAKYMPSMLYKVRMLTFDNRNVREYRPLIKGVSPNFHAPMPSLPGLAGQNNNNPAT